MGTRWWHQGRDAVAQLRWCQSQPNHLGATLVTARLAVLPEAAIREGSTLFAKAVHGKRWTGAVAQQPFQRSAVMCAAVSTMRGVLNEGQTPRRLQEKTTK